MSATAFLFRDDAYLASCEATVVGHGERDGRAGVLLDRTVFYPTGGGQPGDSGRLTHAGADLPVTAAVYGATKEEVLHLLGEGLPLPPIGARLTAAIDWDIRHARMRMHTGLHLLSVVLPYPVTGGSVGHVESRLDFDIPESGLEKEAVTEKLNALIDMDAPVSERWISDDELAANPGLVKTMSVKPPMGSGRVRLVSIEGLDLQPCGGTHVRRTGEIGRLVVTAIEKKGKLNRRVRVAFGEGVAG